MKLFIRSLAVLVAALLAGCATKPTFVSVGCPAAEPTPIVAATPAANLSGHWDWTCCEGHYQGTLELHQEANQLTGRLHDENDPDGSELTGSLTGNVIQLTRTWNDSQQQYELTLNADGKTFSGELSGTRDENVGTHFEATRK